MYSGREDAKAVNPAESIQFDPRIADRYNTMWCQDCQQDVPAVFPRLEGGCRCPRCSSVARDNHVKPLPEKGNEQPADSPSVSAEEPSRPVFDSWELGEQLRHVERVLAAEQTPGGPEPAEQEPRPVFRFDQAHEPNRRRRPHSRRGSLGRSQEASGSAGLRALVWPLLALGLMTFVCGGVLVGWSLAAGRSELWTLGLPIALVGQIGLLTGLVLQLEKIWEDHRAAAAKLDHVDEELHDLKTTTTLLGTSRCAPGTSFYAHMVGGASPQMLLTDLKSQLDLLAVKISREEK